MSCEILSPGSVYTFFVYRYYASVYDYKKKGEKGRIL